MCSQTIKSDLLKIESALRLFERQETIADVNLSLGSRYNDKQFRPSWIKDPETK